MATIKKFEDVESWKGQLRRGLKEACALSSSRSWAILKALAAKYISQEEFDELIFFE